MNCSIHTSRAILKKAVSDHFVRCLRVKALFFLLLLFVSPIVFFQFSFWKLNAGFHSPSSSACTIIAATISTNKTLSILLPNQTARPAPEPMWNLLSPWSKTKISIKMNMLELVCDMKYYTGRSFTAAENFRQRFLKCLNCFTISAIRSVNVATNESTKMWLNSQVWAPKATQKPFEPMITDKKKSQMMKMLEYCSVIVAPNKMNYPSSSTLKLHGQV